MPRPAILATVQELCDYSELNDGNLRQLSTDIMVTERKVTQVLADQLQPPPSRELPPPSRELPDPNLILMIMESEAENVFRQELYYDSLESL